MKYAMTVLLVAGGLVTEGCDRPQDRRPPRIPSRSAPSAAEDVSAAPDSNAHEVPNVPPVTRHKVTLQVQSETWRENEKPFDIEAAIRQTLAAAGVDVISANDAGSEGIVLVSYKEAKGDGYSSFGLFGPPAGNGTRIEYNLTVLSTSGDVLLRMDGNCGTPASVPMGKGLHEAAVESLNEKTAYRDAGTWVRVGLGDVPALPKVLPALVDKSERDAVLRLIEQLKFEPTDPTDQAWVALAREDYTELAQIGAPAVAPLLAFLEKYWQPEDAAKAAAALAEIGDTRASKLVVERAIAVSMGCSSSGTDLPHALSLIESASWIGDAFAIAPLAEFCRRVPDETTGAPCYEVIDAAKEALAAIRARLNAGNQ